MWSVVLEIVEHPFRELPGRDVGRVLSQRSCLLGREQVLGGLVVVDGPCGCVAGGQLAGPLSVVGVAGVTGVGTARLQPPGRLPRRGGGGIRCWCGSQVTSAQRPAGVATMG
jgi:hypothetical protein